MTTTALDLITDALAEIGCAEVGQAIPSADADLALRYLNRLLQRWSNMRLLLPALTDISVPLTGAGSYTIGPSGADVTASRPISVQSAYARDSANIDTPVRVVSRAEWDIITDKTVNGGPPTECWYQSTPTSAMGTIYVYPRATSSYTLHLVCQTLLTSFALADTVTLPEGYESAIVLTLACDLAAPFQVPLRPDVQQRAAGATRAIKRTNSEPLLLNVRESAEFDINRGY